VTGRAASAVQAALKGRCPKCGAGGLYGAYLKLKPACEHCGEDFRAAENGDGPAFFVMFAVGALTVPFAFILLMVFGLSPPWVMAIVAPLAVILSLVLLPPTKALLFAMQWSQGAAEGRLDSASTSDGSEGPSPPGP
jgi:uncharacterized protein (DUF983 family)